MEQKEIITQKCSRCKEWSTYTKKSWKGRENTYCKHCKKILTVTSGGLYLFGGSFEEMEEIASK